MFNFLYSKTDRGQYFEKEDVEHIDIYQKYLTQSTTKSHYCRRQGMRVSKRGRIPFHLKIPFASSSLQFPLCHTSVTGIEVIKAFQTIISLLQRAGIARRIQGYQFRWQIFIGSGAGRRQGERREEDALEIRFDTTTVVFRKEKRIELSSHDVNDAHKRGKERERAQRGSSKATTLPYAIAFPWL